MGQFFNEKFYGTISRARTNACWVCRANVLSPTNAGCGRGPAIVATAGARACGRGDAVSDRQATPDPLVGKVLRSYEIQEPIGVSRWGKVYRGLQHPMNRTVAVRVLSPQLAAVPGIIERFLEETRSDASLTHPHLVTVFEAGQEGGTYFCAMEYMDGPPLPQFLRKEGGVDEHRLLLTI